MASRYYRNRLQQVLSTADEQSLAEASTNWSTNSTLLTHVAASVRTAGSKLDSEIDGEAGRAMVAAFNKISDKLEVDAADMKKGAGALGVAQSAALAATQTHHGIMLSSGLNQMPTKPQGPTPGTQPTPQQETAMGQYNAQVVAYEQNEQHYENLARAALEAMDTDYAASTEVMKEIHGEPDPVEPTPTTPTGSGGGGGGLPPTGPTPPPGTPGTPDSTRDGARGEPRGTKVWEPVLPEDPWFPPGQQQNTNTTTTPTNHPTYTTHHVPGYEPGTQPTTNVSGGTDGGVDYSTSSPATYGPSGSTAGTGGGVSATGMAAGGIAGGAAGAAGMRGVTPAAPLRSAGVKGIGATARPSGPGSLSRGTTAGSSGARGAGSASRGSSVGGSRTAAGAGSRSATNAGGVKGGVKGGAGRRGAGKGKGLFRRGSNGSAVGGRGGKKNDERTEQRDALVYEQDWLGDESAGTGVLD